MTEGSSGHICGQHEIEVAPGKSLPEFCEIQHAILESAGRSIIVTDTVGSVIYFNPAAQRMLGYTWSDVVGREAVSIFHLNDEVEQRARILSAELKRKIRPVSRFLSPGLAAATPTNMTGPTSARMAATFR